MVIGPEDRWVISPTAFDEACPAGCTTGRCKVNEEAPWLSYHLLEKLKILHIGEVKLYNWCNKFLRNNMIDSKRPAKTELSDGGSEPTGS
jgi:hypothetical protein